MRRFAKSVKGSNPSAGSNPVLSASKETRLASCCVATPCEPVFFTGRSCPCFVPVCILADLVAGHILATAITTGTITTGTITTGTITTGTITTGTIATGTIATGTIATGTIATGTGLDGTSLDGTGLVHLDQKQDRDGNQSSYKRSHGNFPFEIGYRKQSVHFLVAERHGTDEPLAIIIAQFVVDVTGSRSGAWFCQMSTTSRGTRALMEIVLNELRRLWNVNPPSRPPGCRAIPTP